MRLMTYSKPEMSQRNIPPPPPQLDKMTAILAKANFKYISWMNK